MDCPTHGNHDVMLRDGAHQKKKYDKTLLSSLNNFSTLFPYSSLYPNGAHFQSHHFGP